MTPNERFIAVAVNYFNPESYKFFSVIFMDFIQICSYHIYWMELLTWNTTPIFFEESGIPLYFW